MKDFLIEGAIVGSGSVIGALAAAVFGGTAWIGALVGGGILFFIIVGFYLAVFTLIAGVKSLLGG